MTNITPIAKNTLGIATYLSFQNGNAAIFQNANPITIWQLLQTIIKLIPKD